jgi:hypothetical protein
VLWDKTYIHYGENYACSTSIGSIGDHNTPELCYRAVIAAHPNARYFWHDNTASTFKCKYIKDDAYSGHATQATTTLEGKNCNVTYCSSCDNINQNKLIALYMVHYNKSMKSLDECGLWARTHAPKSSRFMYKPPTTAGGSDGECKIIPNNASGTWSDVATANVYIDVNSI